MRFISSISRAWRSASLRTQLVAITSGLLLLTLFVTTFVSASLFRQEMVRNLDEELRDNAQNVAQYLGFQVDQGGFQPSIIRFHGRILDAEGTPIEGRSTHPVVEGFDSPQLPELDADQARELAGESFDVPGTTENSRGWRMQVHPFTNEDREILVIALPLNSVETSVERATYLMATIGLLATLGASIIAYSLVTRAFRPLLRVEKTAAAIAGGDFSQRVQTTAPAETEIGRLANSLNIMLAHIEAAFDSRVASEQKMRRFIQDASHELRTPLVTIRGFSELYRQGGISDNPEAVGMAMGRIESEATRMGQLVEDMLTLARLDEQRPPQMRPLDLNIIAHEAVMDLVVNAPDREVKVIGLHDAAPKPAPALGDEGRIRQIVTNLVTNALRYTPEGTPIELAVGTQEGEDGRAESVLEVRDHGDGISAEDAEKIFQRFYRADNSRQRETGGTGLGLAICAAIAAQHGGSVRHSDTAGGGATMTLRLPKGEDLEADHEHDAEMDEEEIEHLRLAALESREQ
ncbi:HAMP domain-containing histidine kinase [Nesterenkonia massiliensis]|uniref:histidine kinase n=1 Tax=Nesterenkonia massiliensis TaxID=1232429 RepID=A0ABT2HSF4_9MICC|nr:HAMP domain-containing sensor histidine kinase [Nesterenkonia massiliensis]MCT1607629.1 HAMP domain-containing histidine kinase [Nesterenkonia massiliensis]